MAREMGSSESIRVLLVDDHIIVREGLRKLLAPESDMQVVGEAGDGHTAYQFVEQSRPDVVVMDLGLPDGDGLSFARQILKRSPATHVIILSAIIDRGHLDEAIEAGVSGYVLKTNASSELIRAIRSAAANETYLCNEASTTLLGGYKEMMAAGHHPGGNDLSGREVEVLRLIADGRNTKEIADALSLSVKTVESHRLRMMAKLNLHSVAELTRYAIRKGLSPL